MSNPLAVATVDNLEQLLTALFKLDILVIIFFLKLKLIQGVRFRFSCFLLQLA
jgi:hypothetical protein